jgi:DNA-binding GntR family transcriptional regulator
MLPIGSKIQNGSTTTVQQIFDRLRRRILTLELKPGQKLVNKVLMT